MGYFSQPSQFALRVKTRLRQVISLSQKKHQCLKEIHLMGATSGLPQKNCLLASGQPCARTLDSAAAYRGLRDNPVPRTLRFGKKHHRCVDQAGDVVIDHRVIYSKETRHRLRERTSYACCRDVMRSDGSAEGTQPRRTRGEHSRYKLRVFRLSGTYDLGSGTVRNVTCF